MKSNSNRRGWIWLAVLLSLFLIVSYFLAGQKAKEYPNYASESPSPTGVKAFYTYLENERHSVKRWSYSPSHLTKGQGNRLLIMIEPFSIPAQKEMKEYEAFMEAGNSILLLKANPEGYFDIKTEYTGLAGEGSKVSVTDGHTYKADILSEVRIDANKQEDVLQKDSLGVLSISRKVGKGTLVVSTSPDWLMNGKILKKDHLPLVLSLLEKGNEPFQTILFDEYHRGGGKPINCS